MITPGTQAKITLHNGSREPFLGVVVSEPIKGQMVILLNDGRAFFGRVSPHTPKTYRTLIQDQILIFSVEDVTLLVPYPMVGLSKDRPTEKPAPSKPKRTRSKRTNMRTKELSLA